MVSVQDQRRSKRFELSLPFELVREGPREVNEVGETRNVSSAGVLFTSSLELEVGAPVEYYITLQSGANGGDSVRLHCVGKVVRRHRDSRHVNGESSIAMAATLERWEFVRPRP